MVAACVLAAAAGAPIAATAQSPTPEPLWKAYPLDEGGDAQATPDTTTQPSAPAPTRTSQPTALQAPDKAGGGPPWLLIVLAGLGGALFMMAVLALGARRDRRRAVERTAPTMVVAPASANGHANGAAPVAEPPAPEPPAVEPEPAFAIAEAAAVPIRRFDREAEPAPTPQQRAAAARRGPICQVRWDAAASRFLAVVRDEDGVEHELARSLRFEWRDSGPPASDHRPAQSALRLLAKDLRERGWRPMRVKGTDLDAPRWYARRFRFPVPEGEHVDFTHGGPAAQRQPSSSQITLT